MGWQNNENVTKSEGQLDQLVNDVLLHPDFNTEELKAHRHRFSAHTENMRLDRALASEVSEPAKDRTDLNGGATQDHIDDSGQFHEAAVSIEVPSGDENIPPRRITVQGLLYQKLTDVIKAAFSTDILANRLHYSPFKLFQRSPLTNEDKWVFSELYNSDTFIQEDEAVKRHAPLPPDDPDCKLEKVVAAIMVWSDATHLANFGTAKLWPIYMFLGNLSKYIRVLPESRACHHLAYISSVCSPCLYFKYGCFLMCALLAS